MALPPGGIPNWVSKAVRNTIDTELRMYNRIPMPPNIQPNHPVIQYIQMNGFPSDRQYGTLKWQPHELSFVSAAEAANWSHGMTRLYLGRSNQASRLKRHKTAKTQLPSAQPANQQTSGQQAAGNNQAPDSQQVAGNGQGANSQSLGTYHSQLHAPIPDANHLVGSQQALNGGQAAASHQVANLQAGQQNLNGNVAGNHQAQDGNVDGNNQIPSNSNSTGWTSINRPDQPDLDDNLALTKYSPQHDQQVAPGYQSSEVIPSSSDPQKELRDGWGEAPTSSEYQDTPGVPALPEADEDCMIYLVNRFVTYEPPEQPARRPSEDERMLARFRWTGRDGEWMGPRPPSPP